MCDTLGKQYSYLCPNMTVFNQRFMVCDHWHYVNCSNSNAYYNLNARMAGGGKKVPTPGRRGSFVDNMEENDIDDADGIWSPFWIWVDTSVTSTCRSWGNTTGDRIPSVGLGNFTSAFLAKDPNSAKLDIPESSTEAPLQDHHNMTMIFPDAKQVNFTQLFGGLIVNPNCPECHPAFLTPGKCTPIEEAGIRGQETGVGRGGCRGVSGLELFRVKATGGRWRDTVGSDVT
ncbi:hypothetical protein HAZT_HAZT003841 [Hyalella azteca]|uniref:Chitin-binding type-2 domain-containing protein n=1 Tax=Hyalella azteca TaxID=294128 RepID=A0A6A0H9B9_HYAAZ|nr:hypothetical protein HAZT_HAZT003841 [Hyalella azteca]